jgi:rhamnosyltransferase
MKSRRDESSVDNGAKVAFENRKKTVVDNKVVVPAAIVLYQPDGELLGNLLAALDCNHRRIFLYLNGAVEPSIQARIDAVANSCVFHSDENVGLGAALNVLVTAAQAEGFAHLQLFDQDSTPDRDLPPDLMVHFLGRARENEQLAVVAPLLTTPVGGRFRRNRYFWRNRRKGTVDFAPTSGSIISLAVWRQIGPFKADYFIGGIDVEWGLRAWHHGYASLIATGIPMVHRWGTGAIAGERWKPQILRQSNVRNYFYIRNAVDTLLLGYIPLGWRLRYAARLFGQIGLLLLAREDAVSRRRALGRALYDGWHGRLGPLPRELASDP